MATIDEVINYFICINVKILHHMILVNQNLNVQSYEIKFIFSYEILLFQSP